MPMALTALLPNGRQVVLRGAAPCCLQDGSPLFLASHALRPGAVCAVGMGGP